MTLSSLYKQGSANAFNLSYRGSKFCHNNGKYESSPFPHRIIMKTDIWDFLYALFYGAFIFFSFQGRVVAPDIIFADQYLRNRINTCVQERRKTKKKKKRRFSWFFSQPTLLFYRFPWTLVPRIKSICGPLFIERKSLILTRTPVAYVIFWTPCINCILIQAWIV